MQRSFHDSLHLSVQIWIASWDLARKGAFDYAAKCQFRIPRMRCFNTLQKDKFRKLTKGKHMMLALYLTLIEYLHIFHDSSTESKGNFDQGSFEVHRCQMLPQWFAGRCVQGDLKDVFANDWRAKRVMSEDSQCPSDEVTYEEKHIFQHQDERVHCTYVHITRLRFKVPKRKPQRPVPRCMHAKLMGEKLCVVGQWVRGTQKVQYLMYSKFVTS